MATLQRRCAWCDPAGTVLDEPDAVVTHGICDAHREEFLRDISAFYAGVSEDHDEPRRQ